MSEKVEEQERGAVWFVDDDRAMVNATAQWLQLSGLKVKSFADPLALLRILKPKQNIIVISDIRMPEMSGIELMERIRKLDDQLPVILITGHGDVPLAVEAMKRGAFEFLTKPFSPEKLLDRAVDALDFRAGKLLQIPTGHFSTEQSASVPTTASLPDASLTDQVESYEKALIEKTLQKHKGKVAKVLEDLGLPRRTLNAKMQKYGINRKALN